MRALLPAILAATLASLASCAEDEEPLFTPVPQAGGQLGQGGQDAETDDTSNGQGGSSEQGGSDGGISDASLDGSGGNPMGGGGPGGAGGDQQSSGGSPGSGGQSSGGSPGSGGLSSGGDPGSGGQSSGGSPGSGGQHLGGQGGEQECGDGTSNCDGLTGCEINHAVGVNACESPELLQPLCGDESCGNWCPAVDLQVVTTRQGKASHWFMARLRECSVCIASLSTQLSLQVPAGVDYHLYVYSSCGTLLGQSEAPEGAPEDVYIRSPDAVNDSSIDLLIEVRYASGASCEAWTLSVMGRSC